MLLSRYFSARGLAIGGLTALLVAGLCGCAPRMPAGFVDAGAGFAYRIGATDCQYQPSLERYSCEGLIEVWAPERCSKLELEVWGRYLSGDVVKVINFPARSISGGSITSYDPLAILPEGVHFTVERLSCMG